MSLSDLHCGPVPLIPAPFARLAGHRPIRKVHEKRRAKASDRAQTASRSQLVFQRLSPARVIYRRDGPQSRWVHIPFSAASSPSFQQQPVLLFFPGCNLALHDAVMGVVMPCELRPAEFSPPCRALAGPHTHRERFYRGGSHPLTAPGPVKTRTPPPSTSLRYRPTRA